MAISSCRPARRRLRASSEMERMRTLLASTPAAADIASRTLAWTLIVKSAMLKGRPIRILMTGAVPEGAGVLDNTTTTEQSVPL